MKHWLLPLFLTLGIHFSGLAQNPAYDPLQAPNSYRSSENPNYWKNRLPHEGYWQQDVHYTIKARIDEKTDVISGKETLVYWNNSKDELKEVYFHLYQNAFQPDSYYDKLQEENKRTQRYGPYENEKKGTEILKMTANGQAVTTELDNTILKVNLPKPLLPGENITFEIEFNTYFDGSGNVRRRMKTFNSFGTKHYDGVHWYPRISVYDRKFGWTTDQHLGREFYGDFGTFDVELTFANDFVVGATGNLVNRKEVLPDDLRKKLDIRNFATKAWNSAPSEVIARQEGKTKTWIYHAENVHDFAFTADPTYRIGEASWNGKTIYALAQEPHAAGWQNAAQYTADIIRVYSEDIGMYVYHKMIVADARDGMEYPMLTLDGGFDPNYRGLLAHEVGHNWFFGQVGNNETYRAALDEGFTQFLTAWCLESLDGDTMKVLPPRSKYAQKFVTPTSPRYGSVYYRYLSDALKYADPSLNTHSDGFHGALRHGGGYGHVYFKTATMLYNLQYVLGDELFLKAMQNYFEQWKIAHPYFNDFRNSIIHYTGADLNWFFDQWMETSKRIDYSVKSIKKGDEENEYLITFERKGRMQMPLDFVVVDNDGKEHKFYIPNTWFEKKTDATILPRWIGWDKLQPTYTAKVTIPGKVSEVIIDPSKRLADVNMLNNSSSMPVKFQFDSRVANVPDMYNYELFGRPEIWYNGYDGIKAGFHINGNYANHLHKVHLTVWYNSGLGQQEQTENPSLEDEFDPISFNFRYETATDKFMKGSSVNLSAKSLDGLDGFSLGFRKTTLSKNSAIYGYFKSMYRRDSASLNYALYANEWNDNQWNNSLNVGLDHHYTYKKGRGDIRLEMRSSALESDYNYYRVNLSVVNDNRLGKLVFRTRAFAQYGTGNNWAPESRLFLAGANPEDLVDNKYTRAQGFVPNDWLGYGATPNNFQMGGGLNLRGYAGYLAPFIDSDDVLHSTYQGESGAAFNGELEFDRLIPINTGRIKRMFGLKSYLFGDVGVINYNREFEELALADIRADAGVGFALTIKRWGPLSKTRPLTLRCDLPLLLNRPPSSEPDYFDFRYVIGVSRAF